MIKVVYSNDFLRFTLPLKRSEIYATIKKYFTSALGEEKQKEILDSIYYARRIQRALITPEFYINKSLNRLNVKK